MHTYLRLAPIMHSIRAVKSAEEIAQMQKACDITEAGFRRLLKPGVLLGDYHIQEEGIGVRIEKIW